MYMTVSVGSKLFDHQNTSYVAFSCLPYCASSSQGALAEVIISHQRRVNVLGENLLNPTECKGGLNDPLTNVELCLRLPLRNVRK